MPYDDKIIYNFHCYEPLIFTHQGAYWIPSMDTSFRCPFHMTYGDYTKYSKEQLPADYINFCPAGPDQYLQELFGFLRGVARAFGGGAAHHPPDGYPDHRFRAGRGDRRRLLRL